MMRSLVAVLLVSSTAGAAFIPAARPSKTTSLQFGFLKNLGIEKPSWLPDFGGESKAKEEPTPVAEASPEGEEATVAADAPAEE